MKDAFVSKKLGIGVVIVFIIMLCINSAATYLFIPKLNRQELVEVVDPLTWFSGSGKTSLHGVERTKDGYIHVKCRVTLKNLSNRKQGVRLAAFMPYEMLIGVNRHLLAYACSEDHASLKTFYLQPNEERCFDSVCFCDETSFNSFTKKMNRLAPWILVKNVDEDSAR